MVLVYQARPSSLLMLEKGLAKVMVELQLIMNSKKGTHIIPATNNLTFQCILAMFKD